MKSEQMKLSGDVDDPRIVSISSSQDGRKIFLCDSANNSIKSVKFQFERIKNLYKSNNFLCAMTTISRGSTASVNLAILEAFGEIPTFNYRVILFEENKGGFLVERLKINLNDETGSAYPGSLVQASSGKIFAVTWRMKKIHIIDDLDKGKIARSINFPPKFGKFLSMSLLMKTQSLKEDVLAISFSRPDNIVICNIQQNDLVIIEIISVGFEPFRSIWIASEEILLLFPWDNAQNAISISLVNKPDRIHNIEMNKQSIQVDSCSWALGKDNQQVLTIFDGSSRSLISATIGS